LKARGFRIVNVVPASSERPPTVTAAADWLPKSGPGPVPPAVPVILIADVQDAEIDLGKKTVEELCSLTPSRETTVGRLAHKHGRRLAHVAMRSARHHGHAKAGPPQLANAVAGHTLDVHAIAQ
jgi:hypothetical protein